MRWSWLDCCSPVFSFTGTSAFKHSGAMWVPGSRWYKSATTDSVCTSFLQSLSAYVHTAIPHTYILLFCNLFPHTYIRRFHIRTYADASFHITIQARSTNTRFTYVHSTCSRSCPFYDRLLGTATTTKSTTTVISEDSLLMMMWSVYNYLVWYE